MGNGSVHNHEVVVGIGVGAVAETILRGNLSRGPSMNNL